MDKWVGIVFVVLGVFWSTRAAGAEVEDGMKLNRVAVLNSSWFLRHQTGSLHPERPDRLNAVLARIEEDEALAAGLVWPAFEAAPLEALGAVHDMAYIRLVQREIAAVAEGRTAVLSTGDTVVSPDSWEAAVWAAGAAMAACDEVMAGRAPAAFALVRPPGHHATRDRGMGFCVFNNVAVAARHLQQQHSVERVLIVDFDVHHGNGTQDIFYEDDSVFFFSMHQHPLYPGTGRPGETGAGPGTGFTLNVDLPFGAGDAEALAVFRERLAPVMEQFRPEFVLVSAGFDGHERDSLGGLRFTAAGYAAMTREILAIADRYASGRVAFVLEGGYTRDALAESVARVLAELQRPRVPLDAAPTE